MVGSPRVHSACLAAPHRWPATSTARHPAHPQPTTHRDAIDSSSRQTTALPRHPYPSPVQSSPTMAVVACCPPSRPATTPSSQHPRARLRAASIQNPRLKSTTHARPPRTASFPCGGAASTNGSFASSGPDHHTTTTRSARQATITSPLLYLLRTRTRRAIVPTLPNNHNRATRYCS